MPGNVLGVRYTAMNRIERLGRAADNKQIHDLSGDSRFSEKTVAE